METNRGCPNFSSYHRHNHHQHLHHRHRHNHHHRLEVQWKQAAVLISLNSLVPQSAFTQQSGKCFDFDVKEGIVLHFDVKE